MSVSLPQKTDPLSRPSSAQNVSRPSCYMPGLPDRKWRPAAQREGMENEDPQTYLGGIDTSESYFLPGLSQKNFHERDPPLRRPESPVLVLFPLFFHFPEYFWCLAWSVLALRPSTLPRPRLLARTLGVLCLLWIWTEKRIAEEDRHIGLKFWALLIISQDSGQELTTPSTCSGFSSVVDPTNTLRTLSLQSTGSLRHTFPFSLQDAISFTDKEEAYCVNLC